MLLTLLSPINKVVDWLLVAKEGLQVNYDFPKAVDDVRG